MNMRTVVPSMSGGLRGLPPSVLLAGILLLGIVLAGSLADLLAPFDYRAMDLRARLSPPSWLDGAPGHWLGTDELGRDMLSRVLHATRTSIAFALIGTVIAALMGSFLGFLSAHRRGLTEEAVMMLVDAQASLPFVLIALAVLAFLGNDPVLFVLLLGLNGWEKFARLVRGAVLSANEAGYAAAARALGARPARLYLRHILPNIASVLIVQFTLTLPDTILLETTLSFLGLGIQPPMASLGQMLGNGRQHLLFAPWIAVIPGLVIVLVTLAVSLIGDWLRDRLDPTVEA